MNLTNLANAAKERGRADAASAQVVVVHHASGEEVSLRFRRPTKGDLFPTPALAERVLGLVGGRHDLAREVILLASTYLPAEEEGQVDPLALFSTIAVADDLLFSDLTQAYTEAFPEFSGWIAQRAARMLELQGTPGKAAGASQEGSEAGFGESPSGSGDSPTNSPT